MVELSDEAADLITIDNLIWHCDVLKEQIDQSLAEGIDVTGSYEAKTDLGHNMMYLHALNIVIQYFGGESILDPTVSTMER